MMRPAEDRYPLKRTAAVVGGILALEPLYRRILEENDIAARIYNRGTAGLKKRIEGIDLIILFPGTVSHKIAQVTRKVAEVRDVPLVTVFPSSLSALRRSIIRIFPDNSRGGLL